MPPDVYGALVSYVQTQLGYDCWLNREAEQTTASARALPYVTLEGELQTKWNFEHSFTDEGRLTFSVYAVGDDAARTRAEALKTLFAPDESWRNIPIQGAEFVQVLRVGYKLSTEDMPDKNGDTVYRYDVYFDVIVSGTY